jgi:hypothetical protein
MSLGPTALAGGRFGALGDGGSADGASAGSARCDRLGEPEAALDARRRPFDDAGKAHQDAAGPGVRLI